MKLLILTQGYPSKENIYANGFIHRRALEYMKYGHEIEIFVLNNQKNKQYTYEGVSVFIGGKEKFLSSIECSKNDAILVHFINGKMMNSLGDLKSKIPVIVWVHGFEALGWYRRVFNIEKNIKGIFSFGRYICTNTIQMIKLKKYIKKSEAKYIFVSKWMKDITEKDTLTPIVNYEIVHNIIDNNLFKYSQKNSELRKKILLIRPFSSRKYATDIATDAIIELSKKPFFEQLEFKIVGEGKFYQKDTNKINTFKNVELINSFLSQIEIAKLHKKYGIFLCPTRQDSQGVSMCEAMSSGLVPITSNNTAIPEFVIDGESGFLTNSAKEIANKIEQLFYSEELFFKMSQKASQDIQEKCSYEATVLKELNIIENYVSKNLKSEEY